MKEIKIPIRASKFFMHHNFDSIIFRDQLNYKSEEIYLGGGKWNIDFEKTTKVIVTLKQITEEEFWRQLANLQIQSENHIEAFNQII